MGRNGNRAGRAGRYTNGKAGRTHRGGRTGERRPFVRRRKHVERRAGAGIETSPRRGLRGHHQPKGQLLLPCRESGGRHPAGTHHPHGARRARKQSPGTEAGGQDCGHLRPCHHGHRLAYLRLMAGPFPRKRIYPRAALRRDGIDYRLPLRLGACHADRHHGGHRQGSRAGHPHQRRREPGDSP